MGKSDHIGLVWSFITYGEIVSKINQKKCRNYWKGDYVKMNSAIRNTDCRKEGLKTGVNSYWSYMKDMIYSKIKDNVLVVEKKGMRPKAPWQTKRCQKSVRKKYDLFKHYERTGRNKEYQEYRKQSNIADSMNKRLKREHEKKRIKKFKGKPKLFYAYMRDNIKVKPTVTQLEKEDGSVTKDDKEVAETLSRFVKSVYTEEDVTTIPNFNMRVPQENIINDVDFTEEDVYR